MKCRKDDGRGQCCDGRASPAGKDGKQAATKERFFDNRAEQHVEQEKIPELDQVIGLSSGASNEVNHHCDTNATYEANNEIRGPRAIPAEQRPNTRAVSNSDNTVQRGNQGERNCDLQEKGRSVNGGLV